MTNDGHTDNTTREQVTAHAKLNKMVRSLYTWLDTQTVHVARQTTRHPRLRPCASVPTLNEGPSKQQNLRSKVEGTRSMEGYQLEGSTQERDEGPGHRLARQKDQSDTKRGGTVLEPSN